ncbi:MAG: hypothetical protein LUC49_01865 [Prevotella sp.]|nr:hypothetical protein [Prevotella sp.]
MAPLFGRGFDSRQLHLQLPPFEEGSSYFEGRFLVCFKAVFQVGLNAVFLSLLNSFAIARKYAKTRRLFAFTRSLCYLRG